MTDTLTLFDLPHTPVSFATVAVIEAVWRWLG